MNINFADRPGFSAYVLLLMFSGLAMVLVGSPVMRRQRPLSRLLNIVFGVGFFAYGFYLAFLFNGGHYVIFVKAFILPAVLIVRSIVAAGRRPATPKAYSSTQQPPTYVPPQTQWAAPPPAPAQWGPPPPAPAQWGPPPPAPAEWAPAPSWSAPAQPDAWEQQSTPGGDSSR